MDSALLFCVDGVFHYLVCRLAHKTPATRVAIEQEILPRTPSMEASTFVDSKRL